MLTRSYRAALCATLPFCIGISAARAQPKAQQNPFAKQPLASAPQPQTNPFAKLRVDDSQSQTQPADAFFGNIEIDQSHALDWGDLIDAKRLKKQIADLDGTLNYREGALGFYRVGYEAIGNRNDGTVRVTVTIVGQSGDRTILATGESVQRWRDGVFLYQEPKFDARNNQRRDGEPNDSVPTVWKPTNFQFSPTPRFYETLVCAPDPNPKRDKDKDDDKPKRAPDPQPKIDSSRAPDPQPKREPEPQRVPDPQPRREDRPRPEPQRAPDPFPPDEPQRPEPPIRPPILHAPDPNPTVRSGRAPNPNPPNRGTVPLTPNPNPPNRGGVHHESRPPRRPDWDRRDDPYGRYPYPDSYPYPAPYPYPYPYPVPYPAPYPAPFPYPYPDPTTVYGTRDGARQAFDYALVQARVDAETDFNRQLYGEDTHDSLAQNQW